MLQHSSVSNQKPTGTIWFVLSRCSWPEISLRILISSWNTNREYYLSVIVEAKLGASRSPDTIGERVPRRHAFLILVIHCLHRTTKYTTLNLNSHYICTNTNKCVNVFLQAESSCMVQNNLTVTDERKEQILTEKAKVLQYHV